MTLNGAFELFLKDAVLTRKSEQTLNNYINCMSGLSNYIIKALPQQDLDLIDRNIIESYFLYGIREKRWSKHTHWTYFKNLKVFFQWCVLNGYLSIQPLEYIPKPRLSHPYPKSLKEQEVRQLLNTLNEIQYKSSFTKERNKAIVATLLFTGIRRGELLRLQCKDVDLETDFIYVERGKGDKAREIPIERMVLKPILLLYLEERNKLFSTQDYFIKTLGSSSGKTMPERAIRAVFSLLSMRFGKRLYPHMLRHTFATILIEKTGDIYTLKELLGHSDIKTTTIYLTSSYRKKVEAISKFTF